MPEPEKGFDFEGHEQAAVSTYLQRQTFYANLASVVKRILADSVAEIQVRTILQHSWAEIEHDIQYKSVSVIPAEIRRRFMSLAGMLEIADREFQAIQDADKRLTEEARASVEGGQLGKVE